MKATIAAAVLLLAAQLLSAQAIPERLKIRGAVYLPSVAADGKLTPVPGATVTAYQGGLYSHFLNCLLNPTGDDPKDCKKKLASEYPSAEPKPVRTTVTDAGGSYAFRTPDDLPDQDTLVVAETANGIGAGFVQQHVGSTILYIALQTSPAKSSPAKPCRDCATSGKP